MLHRQQPPLYRITSDEVAKLLVLARRAREGSDSRNAQKYYNQILDKDPGNWEAIFYTVYFEASECKIMNIGSAANAVANCIYSTFSAISDLESEEEQDKALTDVIASSMAIASMFVNGAVNHYNQFSTTDNAFSECSNRVVSAGNIYGEIAALNPVYGERRELEKQIDELNTQIAGIVTERKAVSGCLGGFFAIVGAIMLILGVALIGMGSGMIWPIPVAIAELLIAMLFLKKKPTEQVIQANIKRKAELTQRRSELQEKLNSL